MSSSPQQQQAATLKTLSPLSSPPSSAASSNSSSLIKLDELSSFGATKQNRLPALIKLNLLAERNSDSPAPDQHQQQAVAANSMPDFSESQLDKMVVTSAGQQHADSLPTNLQLQQADKENNRSLPGNQTAQPMDEGQQRAADESDDFQVVEMDEGVEGSHDEQGANLMGPSLPAARSTEPALAGDADGTQTRAPEAADASIDSSNQSKATTRLGAAQLQNLDAKSLSAQLQSTNLSSQYASHLGDSLIEMIINLRNENQNLVRALETNNEYVKERLSEFKRCQEDSKRREAQYAMEKAEHEHQIRKLQRQNSVLGERLKSMEAKLKDMKLEVSESLQAASSSKASSLRQDEAAGSNLYPQLGATEDESFGNSALLMNNQATTMQIDATSGELYNNGNEQDEDTDEDSGDDDDDADTSDDQERLKRVGAMDTGEGDQAVASGSGEAQRVGNMSKEELSKRFDSNKAQFYSLDDPMKQCDQLEQQLNDIGKRDYEICLLQQQLNIYRQDFRLERMAKLEAKIQIEKLKNDIDRLCLERIQEQDREEERANAATGRGARHGHHSAPGEAGIIGKLGHHLGKKAVKSAAKAAKYAAKRAHLEEKAAAAMARAAAAHAAATSHFGGAPGQTSGRGQVPTTGAAATVDQQHVGAEAGSQQQQAGGAEYHHHHHHRGHHRGRHERHHHARHERAPRPGIRSEVVNDLLSTANKAMLTGYKMASTHVNLALDKLNQFEQQQASQLDPSSRPPIQQTKTVPTPGSVHPSAPPMEPPSID